MYSQAVKNATQNFVKAYGKGIVEAIRGTGLFFPTIIAMKALESGWGKSELTREGNNFGGIKYNPNLQGVTGYVLKDTTEYKKGCKCRTEKCIECQKTIKAKFSKFKDVQTGFRATINLLLSDRYKNARMNAKSPEEQVIMIVESGYSTTPPKKYLAKLQGIIDATRDLTGLGRIS